MTWLLVKVFLGKASDWIVAHWQLVLFGLICLYAYHEKSAYNDAMQSLAAYKQEQTALVEKQKADNLVKYISAQSKVNLATNVANFDMTSLNLNREKSSHDMKALYENKINQLKCNLAANTDSLHSLSTSSASSAVEVASNTEEPSEGRGISDGAFVTLEKACTIETLDYNLLRTWADAVCGIAVCE